MCQMSNGQGSPQVESLTSQLSTKGPDFAVDLGLTRGERTGDAYSLNYMQNIIGSWCLGGTFHVRTLNQDRS